MKIRVGHLYPDYLNIYADRGNIAVLAAAGGLARDRARRSRDRRRRRASTPGAHDLFYVGGGQDREQALVAPDLAAKGAGAARGGRRRRGAPRRLRRLPAPRPLLPRRERRGAAGRGRACRSTPSPGETRMIGDVLLECELEPGERRTLAGFENHAGRTILERGRRAARPRRRGLRQRRRERLRGLPASAGRSARTSTARCSRGTPGSPTGCSPRRWPRDGRRAPELEPLADELEERGARGLRRARARPRRRTVG